MTIKLELQWQILMILEMPQLFKSATNRNVCHLLNAGCDSFQLVQSLCDEQLVFSIQNSLSDKGVSLNMAEVIEAYSSFLEEIPDGGYWDGKLP